MIAALKDMLPIERMVIVDIAPRQYTIPANSQIDRYLNFMEEAQTSKRFKSLHELERGLTQLEPVHPYFSLVESHNCSVSDDQCNQDGRGSLVSEFSRCVVEGDDGFHCQRMDTFDEQFL